MTKIIQLMLVSFSAQVFVFPLIIHYFNQFPTYFWLSNFFAIPFAFVVISCSILLLFTHMVGIEYVSRLLSLVLSYLIDAFIAVLNHIEQLPFSLLTNILWPLSSLMILAIAILLTVIFFDNKKSIVAVCLFLTLIVFQINNFRHKTRVRDNAEVYIHHAYPGSHVNFLHGGNNKVLYSNIDSSYSDYLSSKLKMKFKANNSSFVNSANSGIYKFKQQYFMVFPKFLNAEIDCIEKIEFALIGMEEFQSLKELNDKPIIDCIIIDASIDFFERKKIKEWCRSRDIKIHDTQENGFFNFHFKA